MPISELRIHGVGGSPGERLLGLSHPDRAVVVGEGYGTQFLARRTDRRTEGYDWGGLTSGSRWQPLWVLLLPFTLVNVAGWTHPPFDAISPRRLRALRLLIHLAAGLLTATWVCWLTIIGVDHLGYQWLGGEQGLLAALGVGSPRVVGTLLGAGAVVLVLVALAMIASTSRHRFESTHLDSDGAPPRRWGAREDLASPAFFSHEHSVDDALSWHVGVMVATGLVLLWVTAMRFGEDRLLLGQVFVVLGAAQLAVIAGMLLVGWSTPDAPDGPELRARPRGLPAAAVTLAVALTNGVFSGVVLLAANLHEDHRPWGPELALMDGFVLSTLVWVVLTGTWLAWHRGRGSADDVPPRRASPAQELDGLGEPQRRQVARLRGLAAAGHDAARPLTWFAWLFLASSATLSALRLEPAGPAVWTWLPTPEVAGPLLSLAAWLLPLGVLGTVAMVWRSTRTDALRRGVGILWDVLTFWPRRYHPLAVRPYTERAVPEFRARIEHHLDVSDGLLVSAHSQGTVIAFAALLPLTSAGSGGAEGGEDGGAGSGGAEGGEDGGDGPGGAEDADGRGDGPGGRIGRVGLLTYGSPLHTLYGPAFPAYAGDHARQQLRAALQEGAGDWRNLWRRTDPIGGPVFDGPRHDIEVDDIGGRDTQACDIEVDVECPDPATGPTSVELPEDDDDPEPLRRAWTELRGHSYFYREQAYKDAVSTLRTALLRTPREPV